MSTKCATKNLEFTRLKKRKIVSNFGGGEITSDAGCLLLREVESNLHLLSSIAETFIDTRKKSRITHSIETMLKQRVFGIALGYEDLNDHTNLRKDKSLQIGVNKEKDLASSPTLCRFENKADRNVAVEINKMFVETFIKSHKTPPKELTLDFDTTDDLVYGNQEGKAYPAYFSS